MRGPHATICAACVAIAAPLVGVARAAALPSNERDDLFAGILDKRAGAGAWDIPLLSGGINLTQYMQLSIGGQAGINLIPVTNSLYTTLYGASSTASGKFVPTSQQLGGYSFSSGRITCGPNKGKYGETYNAFYYEDDFAFQDGPMVNVGSADAIRSAGGVVKNIIYWVSDSAKVTDYSDNRIFGYIGLGIGFTEDADVSFFESLAGQLTKPAVTIAFDPTKFGNSKSGETVGHLKFGQVPDDSCYTQVISNVLGAWVVPAASTDIPNFTLPPNTNLSLNMDGSSIYLSPAAAKAYYAQFPAEAQVKQGDKGYSFLCTHKADTPAFTVTLGGESACKFQIKTGDMAIDNKAAEDADKNRCIGKIQAAEECTSTDIWVGNVGMLSNLFTLDLNHFPGKDIPYGMGIKQI